MSKLQGVLEIVLPLEETGKLFFSRGSKNEMYIHLRDPRLWGGNPNVEHWQNANEVAEKLDALKVWRSDIKIDQQSGCLVIVVNKLYTEGM